MRAQVSRNSNFFARLEPVLRAAAALIAVETSDSGMTYAELIDEVGRAAAALRSLGVKPGDRVLALIENCACCVALYLATLKVGGVFSPLSTALGAVDLEQIIADARPTLVVACEARLAEIAPGARAARVRSLLSVESEGAGSFADLVRTQRPLKATAQCRPDDVAVLLYSPAATGRAQGAMITHRNISANAEALCEVWRFRPGDVVLHALPAWPVHGLAALNTALLNGSRVLWPAARDMDDELSLLPRATGVIGQPSLYQRLLAEPAFATTQFRNLRLVLSCSPPPLSPETFSDLARSTGQPSLECYGLPETGILACNASTAEVGERVPGTVGHALPGIELSICDETGRVLPNGELGELQVKGPSVFRGYWRDADLTRQKLRDDGFFKTGQRAMRAADGCVSLVG